MTMEQLKQFALDVHNFAFSTKYDDLDIVSAMDLDSVVEELKKDEEQLKEDNEELKDTIDELESEVLDSRESFNLQQQSDLFYCRGHIYCDPETGENMNRDKLFAIYKDCGKLRKENEELRKENKKGEITCSCQLGFKCEGNFSHPSMICCSYSSDPQTKIIWDYKKQIKELKDLLAAS